MLDGDNLRINMAAAAAALLVLDASFSRMHASALQSPRCRSAGWAASCSNVCTLIHGCRSARNRREQRCTNGIDLRRLPPRYCMCYRETILRLWVRLLIWNGRAHQRATGTLLSANSMTTSDRREASIAHNGVVRRSSSRGTSCRQIVRNLHGHYSPLSSIKGAAGATC